MKRKRSERTFGSIKYRPNATHPTRVVASYATPSEAFDKWPGVAVRQSKSFPLEQEDDARSWLSHAHRLILAGKWEPPAAVRHMKKAHRITMGEYYGPWLEHRMFKGRPLKAGTKYRLRKDIENHIIPYFGNTRLIDITQADIDRWLATMPDDQQAMKSNALRALKSMLMTASKPGENGEPPLIPQYPCTRSLPRPRRKTETVPATPEQIKTIHDAMPERYAMAVYLAVFGDGLRIGEVCALKRKDIDMERHLMHIRRGRVTMDRSKVTDTPKTENSIRDETIPPQLIPQLESFLDEYGIVEPDSWLFPSIKDPSRPVHPNSLRGWYDSARKSAGRPDLRFHDLRHTGLTWLAEDGATVRELMDAAGHSDVETAMRYQHSVDVRKNTLAEKLGERLLPDDTPEIILSRIKNIDRQIEDLRNERAEEKKKLENLIG
ncbi:MAG: site-specific integrase [Bifidobacterium sp.]|nr:site-specific integrase [Bifidobacterium sp.]